jgi:hypothetical protein
MATHPEASPIPELAMGGAAYASRQALRAEEVLDLMSEELFEKPQLAERSKPVMQFLARLIVAHKH